MYFSYLVLAALASVATSTLTFTLVKDPKYARDVKAAASYKRINDAYQKAVDRYNGIAKSVPSQHVNVFYDPKAQTAASVRAESYTKFPSDPYYQQEAIALHELSHVLGVGGRKTWKSHCPNGVALWPNTTKMLQKWDGPGAQLHCDWKHFWPYGFQNPSEFSETAANKNVFLVEHMILEGLQNGGNDY